MDIGKAFGFVFEDEEWIKKLLLGALITLIPVFGQFTLMGYIVAVIRNVLAGSYRPLPEWENLGTYFKDGLMVSLVGFNFMLCGITFWATPNDGQGFFCVVDFMYIHFFGAFITYGYVILSHG